MSLSFLDSMHPGWGREGRGGDGRGWEGMGGDGWGWVGMGGDGLGGSKRV